MGKRIFTGIAALALLVGCGRQKEQAKIDSLPFSIEFSRFENYSPVSLEEIILDDKNIRSFAYNGLDLKEDSVAIKDRGAFRKAILEDAARKGVTEEQIKTLSIKKAIALACALTTERLDYFGTEQEQKTKEFEKGIENLSKNTDPEDADFIREIVGIMKTMDDSIGAFSGFATAEFDKVPVDEIYINKPEIVCRHYATVAQGVFDIFKEINQNLRNTYFSSYSGHLPHKWNQVSTVKRERGKLKLEVAFVDPTWLEAGKIEGMDEKHMGKSLAGLYLDLGKFYESLNTKAGREKALELYKKISNEKEEFWRTQFWYEAGMNEAALLKQDGDNWVESYLAVAKELPDGDLRLTYIASAIDDKEPKEAISLIERMIKNPELVEDGRRKLVFLYLKANNPSEAMQVLNTIQDKPETSENERISILEHVAIDFEHRGYKAEAIRLYSELLGYSRGIENNSNAPAYERTNSLFAQGIYNKKLGRNKEAYDCFKRYLESSEQIPTKSEDQTINELREEMYRTRRDLAKEQITALKKLLNS